MRALAEKKPWPDPRYFFAAPTRDQAKRIAWADLKALVPVEWLEGSPRESDLCIHTVYGSELWVLGMDKPQRMEGPPWDGGVVDEACDQKPGMFDATVIPALADREGWAWLTGVPKRRGPSAREVKERFDKAARGELPDWAAFTWPSSTVLSDAVLAQARASMDGLTYLEQFDATWQRAGGQTYYAFDPAYNVRPCLYDATRALLVGSDFNVNPMAWVVAQQHGDLTLEVIDEIWLENANTPMALEELWRRWGHHRAGFEFYGDATSRARKTSAATSDYVLILNHPKFKAAGRTVHYPGGNPRVADRYATVNAALCTADGRRRLFIDDRCVRLANDLTYVYEEEGAEEATKVGDLTHISDALGYLVMYKLPLSKTVMQDASPMDARVG